MADLVHCLCIIESYGGFAKFYATWCCVQLTACRDIPHVTDRTCTVCAWFGLQSMKAPDLQERLVESEKLVKEMSKTWEEKLMETERVHQVGATDPLPVSRTCLHTFVTPVELL